jgi:hypothetical protein
LKGETLKKVKVVIFFILFCLMPGFIRAEVVTLRPVEDEIISWSPSGCTDHYGCVNEETHDDGTTYLYQGIDNKIEAFVMTTCTVESITGVMLNLWAIRYTIGDKVIDVGWCNYDGETHAWYWDADHDTTITLNGSWAFYSYTPSLSWTADDINNRRFGFRTVSTTDGGGKVTQLYLGVTYTPSEEKEKSGGLIQDQEKGGVAEGGIAR